MNSCFNFGDIKQYENYVINLDKKDYIKMQDSIHFLTNKYQERILELYEIEKENMKEFNFESQTEFIKQHKNVLCSIIKDVLKIYDKELENLEVVFLSGSFSRDTNKMSSDIDLHFFYRHDNYNYVYEEIVCYIISRIINKSRDSIDPTFIFNIESKNKAMITDKMDENKLNVILKYKEKEIKYSYKRGKKRRFYLQYTNTRDIQHLFNYLQNEMMIGNKEWIHCFEVLKGREVFDRHYDVLYQKETSLLNQGYIYKKIEDLKKKIETLEISSNMNSIAEYKKNYQSKAFEMIYDYVSIVRFILIEHGIPVPYFNLLDIYNMSNQDQVINPKVLIEIYRYMWNLEKLTVFCRENDINYGLHNYDTLEYPTEDLDESLEILKNAIYNDLENLTDKLLEETIQIDNGIKENKEKVKQKKIVLENKA